MIDETTLSLLREALDFLNDRPSFGLRRNPRATSYALAARINRHLAERSANAPDAMTVLGLRRDWAPVGVIIDPGETETRRNRSGLWIRAWVLAGPGVDPMERPFPEIGADAYRAAVMQLPDEVREPFLLHSVEGLTCTEIAVRLGTSTADVERRVAVALASLMKTFDAEPF